MKKIIILIPVFNDWQSLKKLLENINLNLSKLNFNISLIVVNDASNEKNTNDLNKFENIKSIKTAVLWKKKDSTFEPDYCAQKLDSNPWIVQPFEHYEEVRVEELIKKHEES